MAPSLALRLTARCQYGTETVKFIFVRDSQASNIDAIISKEKEEAGIESFDPDPGGIKRLNRNFFCLPFRTSHCLRFLEPHG